MLPLNRTSAARRNLQHHWTTSFVLKKGVEIDHVGMRRERLVFPVQQARVLEHPVLPGPMHDVLIKIWKLRRHAPDYTLGSTATDCALRQFS
jgi:hypothetical protein